MPNSTAATGYSYTTKTPLIETKEIVDTIKLYNFNNVGILQYPDYNKSIFSNTFLNIELYAINGSPNLAGLFAGLSYLKTVKLSGINNLKDADYMFYGCTSLKTIYTTEL